MYKIVIIYFLLTFTAFAQNQTDTTTAKKKMPVIEIIGNKILTNSALEFSPTMVIGNEEIQKLAPVQISEILNLSPSVSIKDYGGLGGMKTVSIRGLGSSRTLVLLDGMPISSSQNSSYNLADLPVSVVNNIEIVRGGASTIFGGNAVAGAINIRTDFSPKNKINATIAAGSFGEINSNLTGNLIFDNSHISGNISYLKSDGDFPFSSNQFGEEVVMNRQNADYENISFSMLGKTNINGWNTWARAIYNLTDKGVPGAVLQRKVLQNNERINENNFTMVVNAENSMNNNSSILLSAIAIMNNSHYLEPQKTAQPNSDFYLKDFGLNSKYNFNISNFYNEILATAFYSILTGNMLDPSVDSTVNRTTFSIAYRIEKNIALKMNFLSFNLGGRFDYISDSETAPSAILGMIYSIQDLPIQLKTSFSHNFRAPNFNEMYYRNYGTTNLKPEKSNNFNLGLQFDLFGKLYFEAEGFYLDINDMIASVPVTPVYWKAQNLDKATSSGLEFSLMLQNDFLFINNFILSYTYQKNVDKSPNSTTYNKQLPYTPNELVTIMFSMELAKIDFGFKGDYSSFRYIQTDNNPAAILPSYFTFDLFVFKKLNFYNTNFILRFDCKNLFDEHYEIISNYVMPGRNFKIGCQIIY